MGWGDAAPLVVSPHDACACADERGAALARRVRRAILGPSFAYLVLDTAYLLRYGPPGAAAESDHVALVSGELGAFAGDWARVFDPPGRAIAPADLAARLARSERRFGLVVAGDPEAELDVVGVEVVRTAMDRGVFTGRVWSFERLRPGAAPEPLFAGSRAPTGPPGMPDLCLRLGEGQAGFAPRTLAAAGCVVVDDRGDVSHEPWAAWRAATTVARPVFADLVRALERAERLVEDAELRLAAARAADLPADWAATFAPHADTLRRAFSRTLAASRCFG